MEKERSMKKVDLSNYEFNGKIFEEQELVAASALLTLHNANPTPTVEKSKTKSYYCEYCGKYFSTKGTLKTHGARFHSNEETPHKCEECQMNFPYHFSLLSHKKIHSRFKYKQFMCDKCPRTFSKSSILRDHASVHRTGRPFKCNDCEKQYKTKDVLVRHRKHKHPPQLY